MDERKICQKCQKRKNKRCSVTGNFVPRKKECNTGKFEKK